MIRSIAASIASSRFDAILKFGFEYSSCELAARQKLTSNPLHQRLVMRDRLVGEPDLVQLATLEQLDDDREQSLIGGKTVGNGAGSAKVVGSDRVGVADHSDVHHPYSTLDEHRHSPIRER